MLISYFLTLIIATSEPEDLKSRLLVGWENDDKGKRKVRIEFPNSNLQIRCSVIDGNDHVGVGRGSTSYPAVKSFPGKLKIPSEFIFLRKKFYVTSVRKYAFYKSNIESVQFPAEINKLEPFAFCGCSIKEPLDLSSTHITEIPNCTFYDAKITTIYLPNTIEKIGDQSFSTSHIKNIVFPESITEMRDAAFRMCEYLTSADLSKAKIHEIPERTFERCLLLSTVLLPPTLDSIGEGCFFSCASLESIDLKPYPLNKLGDFVFYNCFKLKQIILPEKLETLGRGCLGATKLDHIELPATLKAIGDNAFKLCLEMRSVDLSDTKLTVIPKASFAKCALLQAISLPATINEICEEAFYMCLSLSSVDLLRTNVRNIRKSAFQSCKMLKNIILPEKHFEAIEQMAFAQSGITNFTAPETVISIGKESFFRALDLQTVDLSKINVTVLDSLTFYDCRSLKKILLPPELEEIGQACLAWCGLNEISFPLTTKSVGHMFLANCVNIRELDMSSTLIKELPYGAFSNCHGLVRVVLPSAMTGFCAIPEKVEYFTEEEIETPKNWQEEKKKITRNLAPLTFMNQIKLEEHSSFYNCKELLSVDLSSTSLTTIPDWMFLNCSGLINVHLPDTIEIIGEGAFRGTQLSDLVIPSGVKEIGQYAYSFNTKLISVDLSKTELTTIQEGTFYFCSQLSLIQFPNGLESIQIACFKGTAFTKITLPQTVNEVGKYAFSDNDELVSIDLKQTTLKRVREGTFSRCTHLTIVILPKNLRVIGSAAFAGCIVKEIAFPKTITTINSAAFAYCTRLKSVLLQITELRTMRSNVFEGCSSLTRIEFPLSLTSIGNNCFLHCSALSEILYLGNADLNSVQSLPKNIKLMLIPSYSSSMFLGFAVEQTNQRGVFVIKSDE